MKSGILGGFLTGTILSGLVLGTVSVVTQLPDAAPDAGAVEVPAGSEFNAGRDDTQAELPDADDTPEAGEGGSGQVDQPEPDDLGSLQGDATEPAAQPETGEAESGLTAPAAPDDVSGVTLGQDEPVLKTPQVLAPEAPEADQVSSEQEPISTEPVQPQQPVIIEESSALTAPEVVEVEPETAAEENQVAEPENTVEATDTAALTVAEEPSSTISDQAEGVETNRLPTIGEEEVTEVEAEAETASEPEEAQPDLPPLQAFATPFTNSEFKPMMSIVLIVDAGSPVSHEILQGFAHPVSFAVDASAPNASARAQTLRDAGLEVLAMVDLPETATATDAEVAMQTALGTIPEAVSVMEGTGTGLQASREAAEQLIPILRESGHGLVLFPQGLDTAQKLIAREGVPAMTVFRDFDSKGQNEAAVRRFLDQAAARASRQNENVIMVGRLREETARALAVWGLQDRVTSVAIAPVSALLQAQQGG